MSVMQDAQVLEGCVKVVIENSTKDFGRILCRSWCFKPYIGNRERHDSRRQELHSHREVNAHTPRPVRGCPASLWQLRPKLGARLLG